MLIKDVFYYGALSINSGLFFYTHCVGLYLRAQHLTSEAQHYIEKQRL